MGVPWHDSGIIGSLLGTRMVLNEFIAYAQLGPLKEPAGSALVHHRVVRPGGLRQLQLGGHPARRHRRAGPGAQGRPRPAGLPGHARRHAGELPVGHDRRDAAVTATGAGLRVGRDELRSRRRAQPARRPAPRGRPSSWARARASLAERLERRGADSLRRHSRLPRADGRRPRGRAGGGHARRAGRCWCRAAAFTCTRDTRRRSRALPVRVFARAGRRAR